jgi:hypothetical protein
MKKTITVHKEDDDVIHHPLILLKFGKLSNLKALLEKGIIHASSISDFRRIKGVKEEKEDFRNDPLEGAIHYLSKGPAQAIFSTLKNPEGNLLSIPIINFTYHEKPKFVFGNICSFYGITTDCFINNELIPVDNNMKSFGSHFIMITNFDEFVKRIDKAMENTYRINWRYGFIKYFNENDYEGNIDEFKKRSRYNFQNEFRLHFKIQETSAVDIEIGSIQDIATIVSSDVLEFLKIKLDIKNKIFNINWLKQIAE